jgi:hypothetical protein
MKNQFLETNVIIDVLGDSKPFSNSATRLLDLAEKGKINLVSFQTMKSCLNQLNIKNFSGMFKNFLLNLN